MTGRPAARTRSCGPPTGSSTGAVISQQLQQYDGHMVTCPPKTSHSARVILGSSAVGRSASILMAQAPPFALDGDNLCEPVSVALC